MHASVNLLAQASTLDMSRPPWRHDRLPDGRARDFNCEVLREPPAIHWKEKLLEGAESAELRVLRLNR